MHIEYAINGTVSAKELIDLLKQTSWASDRDISGIDRMLDNTPLHITARYDGALVEFARYLSDFTFRSFIDDVIVDDVYRGQGIGAQLFAQLLQELADVEAVVLACDEALVPYYQKQGFSLSDHPHMIQD